MDKDSDKWSVWLYCNSITKTFEVIRIRKPTIIEMNTPFLIAGQTKTISLESLGGQ